MLERRLLDIYCEQRNIYRGKPIGLISWKAAEYKLFWIGNEKYLREVGIFLARKSVDKVFDIVIEYEKILKSC